MRSPLSELRPEIPRRGACCRLPLIISAAILAAALLAPLLAPYDPLHAFAGLAYQPPSALHLLGTDTLGRDVLSRVLWGGRQTLGIALQAVAITILPGLAIGIIAGFYRHTTDRLLMGTMDVLLAFPNLLLALAIISLLGTGREQVALAVGLAGLPAYARITRTAVLNLHGAPYIEAAHAIGVQPYRILIFHILPNAAGILLSFAAVSLSWAVLNGAALAFLGFSGSPATPDWGVMLNEGRTAFRTAPWIALPPGLAITLTVFAINRLADAWQDNAAHTR